MKKGINSIRNKGFTLIEVLVTVVIIGVLAAVVIPAVVAQVTAGDSSRVINDLTNLRTGIENFDIAVRQFPGDVDDLVNKPGTSASSTGADVDADVTGATYLGLSNWAGPYVEAAPAGSTTSSTLPNFSGSAFNTGYAATVNNKFLSCAITQVAACSSASADYVVIELDNLTGVQMGTLNTLIDGSGELLSSTSGKLRTSGTASALYYASPLK